MVPMLRRSLLSLTLFVAVVGLVTCALSASAQHAKDRRRKFRPPPPTARIEVTVLRDTNGKPIENASVIFHLVSEKGAMQLKTNEDGQSMIDVFPLKAVFRLQIIAKGFQTYGADYSIDNANLGIEIRMKRPGEQYSIYKSHDMAAESSKGVLKPAGEAAQPK